METDQNVTKPRNSNHKQNHPACGGVMQMLEGVPCNYGNQQQSFKCGDLLAYAC